MLDDRERALLLDIENHLRAEDPGWCAAFAESARPARDQHTFELVFHVVAMLASAALTLLMVMTNAVLAALLLATTTVFMAFLVYGLRRTVTADAGSGGPEAPPSTTDRRDRR